MKKKNSTAKKSSAKKNAGKADMRLRVGVLFGGRSGEHEISLISAASILKAIDRTKYDIVPIGIDKQGRWLSGVAADHLLHGASSIALTNGASAETSAAAAAPTDTVADISAGAQFAAAAAVLRSGENLEELHIPALPRRRVTDTLHHAAPAELAHPGSPLASSLDVVFPVLHGTFGEDGTIQGLFELADIAYVGSGVLGSSAAMDKDAMKRLFAAATLPQTPYLTVLRGQWNAEPKRVRKQIETALRYPLFVKPVNLGSSVGISKVHDRSELAAAMDLAASFDRKIVVEQGVGGPGAKPRELEVAVLGNDAPEASVVGEIVPNREFYDYESKYESAPENPSLPIIPAKLTKSEAEQIRQMAVAAFRACDCSGLARVDFLMDPGSKKMYVNEINTLPGFTSISMYPKMWAASGIPYPELMDRLIQLGMERHAEKKQNQYKR
jgi:D-alanine-D-alanine ligase